MKFITDKIAWTEAMKKYTTDFIEDKFDNLPVDTQNTTVKLYRLNADKVKVVVSVGQFRAQSTSRDFYVAMSGAANRLKTLVVKAEHKEARRVEVVDSEQQVEQSPITKEKILLLNEISADDAIAQFEKTDYGFFVFKDTEVTSAISVLYRRQDGTFGVIRCK